MLKLSVVVLAAMIAASPPAGAASGSPCPSCSSSAAGAGSRDRLVVAGGGGMGGGGIWAAAGWAAAVGGMGMGGGGMGGGGGGGMGGGGGISGGEIRWASGALRTLPRGTVRDIARNRPPGMRDRTRPGRICVDAMLQQPETEMNIGSNIAVVARSHRASKDARLSTGLWRRSNPISQSSPLDFSFWIASLRSQ